MRLFEFVRSGDSRENFYSATLEFANTWEERTQSWETDYTPELAKEEAEELRSVAKSFLKGIKAGAKAFRRMDTMVRDELAEYWDSVGLDSRIIYDLLDNEPQKEAPFQLIDGFTEWESAVKNKYPSLTFTKLADGNIDALSNNVFVGQWIVDSNHGTIKR